MTGYSGSSVVTVTVCSGNGSRGGSRGGGREYFEVLLYVEGEDVGRFDWDGISWMRNPQ